MYKNDVIITVTYNGICYNDHRYLLLFINNNNYKSLKKLKVALYCYILRHVYATIPSTCFIADNTVFKDFLTLSLG